MGRRYYFRTDLHGMTIIIKLTIAYERSIYYFNLFSQAYFRIARDWTRRPLRLVTRMVAFEKTKRHSNGATFPLLYAKSDARTKIQTAVSGSKPGTVIDNLCREQVIGIFFLQTLDVY